MGKVGVLSMRHEAIDNEYIDVPNPQFYDFGKDTKEECFEIDQIWAVYDNMDIMPRSYAQIVQVFTPGFEVGVTWLEPDPDNEDETDWVGQDLPVSCGKFKYGKPEITDDLEMFSHLVTYSKSTSTDSIVIYPKKGETWALFKNWDIKWSSDSHKHRNYEFNFVVILSDYDELLGITVAYLEKVDEFVCLFKQKEGMPSIQIPPKQLYSFSHMVPSYRTTGKERGGVPQGYFELDPASLPSDLVKDTKEVLSVCPSCKVKKQFYKGTLGIPSECNDCMKLAATDANLTSGTIPTKPLPQLKEVCRDGCKMGSEGTGQGSFSDVGYQGNFDHGTTTSKIVIEKSGVPKDLEGEGNENVNGAHQTESRKRPNHVSGTDNTNMKRRKLVAESIDSCRSRSDHSMDELEILEKVKDGESMEEKFGILKVCKARRSTRRKRQSRNDDTSEKKKEKSLKEVLKSEICAPCVKNDTELNCRKGSAAFEQSSHNGNFGALCHKKGKGEAAITDEKRKTKILDGMESNSNYKTKLDLEPGEIAEPEFHSFDKDRLQDCFETHQVWAVYDSMDGMPRIYARINKVLSPSFKVRITWLDLDTYCEDTNEIDLVDEELPISCGKFKHGKTEITEDIYMFSHIVPYKKHPRRGLLVIYPRKGETWALFKNWEVEWNSNPDNYWRNEYDLVEIMSDYNEASGITLAYLEKVKGFVSLFRQPKGARLFQIPQDEFYRFSHMVPSYRMTGKEKGIPEGYLELDPASLPCDIEESVEANLKDVDAR